MLFDECIIGLLVPYMGPAVYGQVDIDIILSGTDKASQTLAFIFIPFIQFFQPTDLCTGSGVLAIGIVSNNQALSNAFNDYTIKIKG